MRPRRIPLDGNDPFKNIREGQQFQVEVRGLSPFKGEAVYDNIGRLYFRPMLGDSEVFREGNNSGTNQREPSEPVFSGRVTTLFFLDPLARKASP